MPPDHAGVRIHPQGAIHSIVKVVDGSLPAHLSVTDMRLPILCALTYRDCLEPELLFLVCASNKTTKHEPLFPGSSSMATHFTSTQEEL